MNSIGSDLIQLSFKTVDSNNTQMISNLNQTKFKELFNYSIVGLAESIDYSTNIIINTNKIIIEIFYVKDGPYTTFRIKNNYNLVSVTGQPVSMQSSN